MKNVLASIKGKMMKTAPQDPVDFVSAEKSLLTNLADKLIEIEEQIYAGSLDWLRIVDRDQWKASLLKFSSYASQTPILDSIEPQITESKEPVVTEEEVITVSDFAKALLLVEQSIEKRFFRVPLGDLQRTLERKRGPKPKAHNGDQHENSDPEDKGVKSQTLQNWEKSLMSCATYSQVFLHLQGLDESIAWSKSILNACCRLCWRKSHEDKMLLCDKCDCGHHIFCLRPPLTSIPEGEWFCPKCKPKKAERTPRKIRKTFNATAQNDEIYSADEDNSDAKSDSTTGRKRRKVTSETDESDESSESESEEEEIKKPKRGERKIIESSQKELDDEDLDNKKRTKMLKKNPNLKHLNGSVKEKDSIYR